MVQREYYNIQSAGADSEATAAVEDIFCPNHELILRGDHSSESCIKPWMDEADIRAGSFWHTDIGEQSKQQNQQLFFWDHSLYNEVLISLGKREIGDAVDAPWKYTVEVPDTAYSASLDNRDVSAVYDATGLLLILGEPGSGKTTTLIDLSPGSVCDAR
jgi:hypothetical protein